MPRGRKPGPKKIANVAHIFEQFVGSLSALIKEKVGESVHVATVEFLNSKLGASAAKTVEKVTKKRRRRRGRKPGRKPGRPAKRLGRPPKKLGRPKGKRGPGRPPKAKVEAKPAEPKAE